MGSVTSATRLIKQLADFSEQSEEYNGRESTQGGDCQRHGTFQGKLERANDSGATCKIAERAREIRDKSGSSRRPSKNTKRR